MARPLALTHVNHPPLPLDVPRARSAPPCPLCKPPPASMVALSLQLLYFPKVKFAQRSSSLLKRQDESSSFPIPYGGSLVVVVGGSYGGVLLGLWPTVRWRMADEWWWRLATVVVEAAAGCGDVGFLLILKKAMEELQSPIDKQTMVSSFLEIAVGQTADTARQFLQATSWKLEEAIQLFYVGNEGVIATPSAYSPPLENDRPRADQSSGGLKEDIVDGNAGQDDIDGVRAPIPVKREVLYDNAILYGPRMGYSTHEAHSVVPFRNFNEEMKRAGVWDQGGTSVGDSSQDNLASLYRPPFALMHHGPFEKWALGCWSWNPDLGKNSVGNKYIYILNGNAFMNLSSMLSFGAHDPHLQAKDAAKFQDKWFLVNVQSTKEFSSHMLNRDTWANEAVAQTISSNFIFWQVYDDTEEGRKVSTYYKLDSFPVILVIDPITGQKMRSWRGMVQAESLLENLLPFLDGSPKDHHVSLSHKRPREGSQTPAHKVQEAPVAADATNEEDEELLQALAASMEGTKDAIGGVTTIDKDVTNGEKEEEQMPPPKKATYPQLPEEPTGDRNLLCRVGVRLPDGRRLQRSFWHTDPIQLLWSFCSTHLEEAEQRPFRLTQAIPGASNVLDYDSKLTFAESGLANSMISVTWE
ncbi:hypothetical protein RHGRI_026529 [Rhododendron griersonianum]|uniref:UBX domain-containing protein n=1 Tax=Rhododendron griersonianum TaxID=479676 RepID=A0AAV6IY67_9ERIC|nr:hypothetical protein RHGRI_026529 [Rhododendron griersonianum]